MCASFLQEDVELSAEGYLEERYLNAIFNAKNGLPAITVEDTCLWAMQVLAAHV